MTVSMRRSAVLAVPAAWERNANRCSSVCSIRNTEASGSTLKLLPPTSSRPAMIVCTAVT
ncbi:MAG: hypothetical protein K5695_14075 [Oscillospiraceae bacterium]|nr:hypothetical protein [Oscillospiraceae bacterium]